MPGVTTAGVPVAVSTRLRAWIEVDTTALVHNAAVVRRSIPGGTRLGLLVKANAYGHGLEMAARAAVRGGADRLIVANVDEALAVRGAGIDSPILVAYPAPPDAIADAVEAGLELTLSGLDSTRRALEAWGSAGIRHRGRAMKLHVEVDTGMGRGGVAADDLVEVIERIEGAPQAEFAGIWSHLADGRNAEVSTEQAERFESAVARLSATGRSIPTRHLLATEAIFARTAPAYDMVRVGLGFYGELGLGFEPAPEFAELAAELRPAMAIKARPVRLESMAAGSTVGYGREWTAERRSLIATLPVGYADGWTRTYWPGAQALVRGRPVALVGRVSMDSVCADVTDAGEVTMDDEFVLLGAQGNERITPNELARLRNSITNEVFTSFGPRLPRIYFGEDSL